MNRLFSLVLASTFVGLAACAGGPAEGSETPTTSSTDPSTPTSGESSGSDSKAGSSADAGGGASAGPQCTAYFACCDEIAKSQPALAGSCDSTRNAVDEAVKNGASTTSYESACEQALSSAKSAGYCK